MLSQKRILVVEDNPINRMMLVGILSPDYEVLEAENGQEALEILKRFGDDISLILLDIVMPVMDGYAFLSLVKANATFSAIPVIVTTQNDGESDEVSALSHGATDFVAKPYKPQVILHRVASIINLRENAAMINQLQYDRLTGIYSKEFFYQRVKEMLVQNPHKKFDIVCSDIENFKLVNDVFGVSAGDRLLCGVADLYTRLLRDRGICGRLNADQFVCFLEHRQDYTDEMFISASAQISSLSIAKNIVVKWGVYEVRDRSTSVERMCDRALLAVRSIKGQYGKYFASYDDKLRGKLLREQKITDGMELALAEEQFAVYLQPMYKIEDDSLAGAEALVRWRHPEWGTLFPPELIPIFEKNGFITKLDEYIWDKTCAILRNWEEKGIAPISASVNVSRADIYNADLADILVKTVEKHGLSPDRLHLEITESAYTEDPEQIIQTVSHLRELGFIVEMDDFGSGYSSLNMLNQMPLDILKLDMKFIQSETAKPVNHGILRFIIGLARWMNLSVVAEGVETKEQLDRLREIGCDYVQGYYFAKPMPCEQFEALFKSRRLSAGEAPARAPEGEPPQKILLVADAFAAYRQEVRQAFAGDFQVMEAANCEEALNCIGKHGAKMAAILLSMTLPPDGSWILEILRKEKAVWEVPVIVTAPQDAGLEERAWAMGADDFAVKPHSMENLRRRVARAIAATHSRERERALRWEACRDFQTGLLNRRGLSRELGSLHAEDLPLALYLFDLDNLKMINDTYGHFEGDRLIQEFGAILLAHTGKSGFLARYGGDEFVVVIKRMKSAEAARQKGEEICHAFRKIAVGEGSASCTAGIVYVNPEDSLKELVVKADRALYRAKKENKGGCCLWRE